MYSLAIIWSIKTELLYFFYLLFPKFQKKKKKIFAYENHFVFFLVCQVEQKIREENWRRDSCKNKCALLLQLSFEIHAWISIILSLNKFLDHILFNKFYNIFILISFSWFLTHTHYDAEINLIFYIFFVSLESGLVQFSKIRKSFRLFIYLIYCSTWMCCWKIIFFIFIHN